MAEYTLRDAVRLAFTPDPVSLIDAETEEVRTFPRLADAARWAAGYASVRFRTAEVNLGKILKGVHQRSTPKNGTSRLGRPRIFHGLLVCYAGDEAATLRAYKLSRMDWWAVNPEATKAVMEALSSEHG